MTPSQSNALLGALELAAQGLPCFALNRNKRPTLQGGFYNATTDTRELRALWERGPGTLIGVPCGHRSMFDVLDIDLVKHPETAGAWWKDNKDTIPRSHPSHAIGRAASVLCPSAWLEESGQGCR